MSVEAIIKAEADARNDLHKDHESNRPLSANYEEIGLAGEFEFSQFCGVPMDMKRRPGGDGGKDSTIFLGFTVDVKTAAHPTKLLHEQNKGFADIFVLAGYDGTRANLIGWEWGRILAQVPPKDTGKGVINHWIPAHKLRPMNQLDTRMLRLGSGRGA